MAVVMETTLGDLTVDLFVEQRPQACLNFLKLCKMKYYNFSLFHSIQSGFLAQAGDPTGGGSGGESIWGLLEGKHKRYFTAERVPKIRHSDAGMLSMVCVDDSLVGSQFFFTLGANLDSLDSMHCVIGIVTEGHDVLRQLNEVICDETHRPYRDVRVTHTVVLDDPYDDPPGLYPPDRSPSPSAERLIGGRIAPDEEIDETQGKSIEEINEFIEKKEAKARATILEIVGDLPDADVAPPENVLFVCKLNPVTTDSDLEIIFSRFGKIVNCEVIRDKKSGDSLQYAFIEFEDQKSCENAYFKMDNSLIDDRRIHVDFSQSVSKIKWLGKGRGVKHFNEKVLESKKSEDQTRRQPRSRDREHKSGRQSNSRSRDDRQRRRSKSRTREDRLRRRSQSRDRDRRNRTEREDRKRERDKDGSNRRYQKSKSRSPISRAGTKYSRDSSQNQDHRDKVKELSDNYNRLKESSDKYNREKDTSNEDKISSDPKKGARDYSGVVKEDKPVNNNGDTTSKLLDTSKKEKKYLQKSERESPIDKKKIGNTEITNLQRNSESEKEQPATENFQPLHSKLSSRTGNTISQKDEAYLKGNTKKYISKSPKKDMELLVHPRKDDGNYRREDRLSLTKEMQDNENREEIEHRKRKESAYGSHLKERLKDSELLRSDKKYILNRGDRFTQSESSGGDNPRKSDENYKREDRLSSTKNMQENENREHNEHRNRKESFDNSRLKGLRDSELLRSDTKSFNNREARLIPDDSFNAENVFHDQLEIHKKSSGSIKENFKRSLERNEEQSFHKYRREGVPLIHSPRTMRVGSNEDDKILSQQCRNQNETSDFVKGQRRPLFSKGELDSTRDMRKENLREGSDSSDLRRKQKYASDASKRDKESSLLRKEKEYAIEIQRGSSRTENDCTDQRKKHHEKEYLQTIKKDNDREMQKRISRREDHQSDRRRNPKISEVSDDEMKSLLPRIERKHSENYNRNDALPAGDPRHGTLGREKNVSEQHKKHSNVVVPHNVDLLSEEKKKHSIRDGVPFEQSELLIQSTKVRHMDFRENDRFSEQLIKQRDSYDRPKGEREPGEGNRHTDYLDDIRQEKKDKITDNSHRNKVSRREQKESYGRVSLEPTRRVVKNVENSVQESVVSSDRHLQFFDHPRRGRNSDHSGGTSENSRRGLEYLEESKGERGSSEHSRRDFEYSKQTRDEAEIVDRPNRELVFSENSRGERFVRSRWDTDYLEETRHDVEPPRRDLEFSDNLRVERVPVTHSRWDTDYPEEPGHDIESIDHPRRHFEYLQNSEVAEHRRRDLELMEHQRGPADHTNLEYFEHSRGEEREHSRRKEYSNNLRERVSVEYPRRDLEYLEDSRCEIIPPEHTLRNIERFEDSRGRNTYVEQGMIRKDTFENSRKRRELSSHSGPERFIRPESPRREMDYFENPRMENIAFSDRVRHSKEMDEHSMRQNKPQAQERSRNKIEYFANRTDDNPTNYESHQNKKDKYTSEHLKRDKTSEQYKTERENVDSQKNTVELDKDQNKALLQSSRREKGRGQKVKSVENYKDDKEVKLKSRTDDILVRTSSVTKATVEPISKQKSRGTVSSSKDKLRNMSTEFEASAKTSRTDRSSDRNFNDGVKQAQPGNKCTISQSKDAHSENTTNVKERAIGKTEVKRSQQRSVSTKEDSKAKVKKLRQKEPKKSKRVSKEKIKKLVKKKKIVGKKKGKETSSSSSDSSDISSSSSTDSSSSESDHKKKSIKKRRRKRKVSTSSSSSSETSSSSTSDTDSSSESSSSSSSSESSKRPKKKSVPDKKKETPKIKNKDKT